MVRVAWATGLLCVAVSAALVLQVLRMRRRLARRKRRAEAVIATWRPLLFEVVAGGSPRLPPLASAEEDAFLLLWLQLLDAIRGAPRANLAAVGETVGAHALAHRRIRGTDAVGRILALRTLGYLRRPDDRAEVLRWLDDPRAYVSLAAARALVHLDPDGSADDILPRLATRTDWPIPLFASVLEETSRSRLSARFRALCGELPAPILVRVLPLASLVDAPIVDEILSWLLDPERDPEVLAAALRHVRGPALLPAVRRTAVHERWSVRVQAAAALGRVGEPADGELLLQMTRDPEWWVRYRAAQALAAGPFAAPEEIVARAAHLRDRFARDMVRQVLAEAHP
ncbi:MAG TPA: HEAT repeat domain-containing protein [Anaeromyxobacter sp.]|nr:HEAT repeat domain-containing protein [Anaeromyxobacter sp.]